MRKNLLKKAGILTAIAITLLSNAQGVTAFADSPEDQPVTYASTVLEQPFSGKNNTISGSIWANGYHTYTTNYSQGAFSCRLTERFSGTSPDRVVQSNTGSNVSLHYLSGGTYYIRYEGNSDNAKTTASLLK